MAQKIANASDDTFLDDYTFFRLSLDANRISL